VVGRGFLVVKLWWIAGERWEVDGQDSGSKNMPLVPDLFLRDSHFGNLGRSHPSLSRRTATAIAPTSTSTASSPAVPRVTSPREPIVVPITFTHTPSFENRGT
jgi:hypothetical protein